MEFGLGVVLVPQGVLLPTWRCKLDMFWDGNSKNKHKSLLRSACVYSFYFCPSISSLPPSFPPSLHHFDLVVRASLSLLSGPQFLAGLLKCDFLHPVFKKGFWALQVSCCFSPVSTSLLHFPSCFSVSFVCASLHWSNLSPSDRFSLICDHYHSSIFLLHSLSVIIPFSLLCLILSILPSFLLSSVCWDFFPTD